MVQPIRFLTEVRSELTKVTYPTRKEVTRLTLIVIGVSLVVSLFLWGLDAIFTKLFELLLSFRPQ